MRLLTEGVAIFFGVALALIAEDWRQTRADRDEARESLALVAVDLRSDSAEIATYGRGMARHAAAANWLIRNWGRADTPQDSLESQLYQFSLGPVLQASRSAFEGLRDSNRLRLIEPDTIRHSLANYYQVRQVAVTGYASTTVETTQDVWIALAPYQLGQVGRDSDHLWPPAEPRVELVESWEEVSQDLVLRHYILTHGRIADAGANIYGGVGARIVEILGLIDEELAS